LGLPTNAPSIAARVVHTLRSAMLGDWHRLSSGGGFFFFFFMDELILQGVISVSDSYARTMPHNRVHGLMNLYQ